MQKQKIPDPFSGKKGPGLPAPQVSSKKKMSFGFQFWRQVDLFGIGTTDPQWTTSLLTRLGQLSQNYVEDIFENHTMRMTLHIHEINWGSRGTPMTREQFFELLPGQSRTEDVEPLQIMISLGLGRIHGFLDGQQVFQIVLLDPNHNLQPSKRVDYQLRKTERADTHLDDLKSKQVHLLSTLKNYCEHPCDIRERLADLASMKTNAKFFFIDDILDADSIKHLEQKYGTLDDAVFTAITSAL